VLLVDRPGAVQSEIRIGHLGVQRLVDDYFPIVVMNTVLGGSFSSRLNLNLREVHGYTYGVSSGFGMRRQAGPFLIATATETDVTVSAITEILKEVEHLRQGGVSSEELESASGYLAGVFPLRLQTTAGVAAHLAELEIYGLPDDHFDRYRERVLAVTAEEVLLAARTRLDPASLNIAVVGDAERLREPLDALGLGPVEPADVSMEGG
jgi:zinc protease